MATTTEKKTETPKDPWQIKKTIRIPNIPGVKAQPDQSVFVNGRFFQIQRGKDVEVPLPVAEVVERSFVMEQKAEDFYLGRSSN